MKNLVIIFTWALSVSGLRISNEVPEKEAINGGSYDQMSKVPYVAFMTANYFTNSYTCSAAILSRSWLLTCAHCVQPGYTMTVGVGSSNNDLEFLNVERAVVHHGYKSNHNHDLALLKLVQPIALNQFRQPIAILNHWNTVNPRSWLKFSGFGTEYRHTTRVNQNQVKSINQKIVSSWDCKNSFQVLSHTTVGTYFCASTLKGGPCGGDSGGPVVLDNKLVGIDFYGSKNCEGPNSMQVYVNVTSYYDWILKNTAGDARFIEQKARGKTDDDYVMEVDE